MAGTPLVEAVVPSAFAVGVIDVCGAFELSAGLLEGIEKRGGDADED